MPFWSKKDDDSDKPKAPEKDRLEGDIRKKYEFKEVLGT